MVGSLWRESCLLVLSLENTKCMHNELKKKERKCVQHVDKRGKQATTYIPHACIGGSTWWAANQLCCSVHVWKEVGKKRCLEYWLSMQNARWLDLRGTLGKKVASGNEYHGLNVMWPDSQLTDSLCSDNKKLFANFFYIKGHWDFFAWKTLELFNPLLQMTLIDLDDSKMNHHLSKITMK